MTVVGPPTVLTNGVPVTVSGAAGSLQYWTLEVPAGQPSLAFTTRGGTGDVDLYVRRASAPTASAYDCRPYLGGNIETCTINAPAAGTWYVMLAGFAAYSGVTLQGIYPAPNDFVMDLSPSAGSTAPGTSVTATLYTGTSAGVAHTVALSASKLPAGVTVTFAPPVITSGGSSALTIAVAAATVPGTYDLAITGTGSVVHTATYSLTVEAPPVPLINGVPVTGLSGTSGSQRYWTLEVPAGQASLAFSHQRRHRRRHVRAQGQHPDHRGPRLLRDFHRSRRR